jgi:hypothetical protein
MSLAAKAWAAAAVPETLGKRAGAGIGAARKRESDILSAPTHRQRRSPNPLASVGGFMARTQPRTRLPGLFFTRMPVWCRSVAGSPSRRGLGCCVPLLTHLPSYGVRSVSPFRSGFLAPAPPSWPGLFFWWRLAIATAQPRPAGAYPGRGLLVRVKVRLRLRRGRRGGRRRGRRCRGMGGYDHRLNNRLDPAFGQNQRAQ